MLKFINVFCTLSLNSSNFSSSICLTIACVLSSLFTKLKVFYMGFKSGLRVGIWKTPGPFPSQVRRAIALFCQGQPSCRKTLSSGLQLAANASSNSTRIIFATIPPVIAPKCCFQSTKPLPCEIATMKFAFFIRLRSPHLVLPRVFATLLLLVLLPDLADYFYTQSQLRQGKKRFTQS